MGDFVLDATVFLNVQRLDDTDADHIASVTAAVSEAETWVRDELSEAVNGETFPTLLTTPATPGAIRLMALWEASALALSKIFGREGKDDQNPVAYWHGKAMAKLKSILAGHVQLEFASGFVGPAAQDYDTNKEPEDSPDGAERVKPYLGYGQDGEYIETSTGVEDRADIDYDDGASDDD